MCFKFYHQLTIIDKLNGISQSFHKIPTNSNFICNTFVRYESPRTNSMQKCSLFMYVMYIGVAKYVNAVKMYINIYRVRNRFIKINAIYIHVTNKNLSSFIYFKFTGFCVFSLCCISLVFILLFSILTHSLNLSSKTNMRCFARLCVGNFWPVAKFRFTIKISCASDFCQKYLRRLNSL